MTESRIGALIEPNGCLPVIAAIGGEPVQHRGRAIPLRRSH